MSLYGLSDIINGRSTETCETTVQRRSGVERWRHIGSRRTDVGNLLVKELVCLIRANSSRYRSTTATHQSVDRAPQLPGSKMFRVDFRLPEVLLLLAQQLTVFTSPCLPRLRRRVHSRQVVWWLSTDSTSITFKWLNTALGDTTVFIKPWIRLPASRYIVRIGISWSKMAVSSSL